MIASLEPSTVRASGKPPGEYLDVPDQPEEAEDDEDEDEKT